MAAGAGAGSPIAFRRPATRCHKVWTPTRTGLGERSHLIGADIDLSTHVTDIVNVLKWERLSDVALCSHCYGGFVISGVAEAIASLIFVDALVPENGDTVAAVGSATTRVRIGEAQARGEATVAPTSAAFFQVNEADRAWVDALCTPQPLATLTQQAVLTGARERIPRKTYIRARGCAAPAFDGMLAKARAMTSWRIFELDCGHDVMVDMPDALAQILLQAA
jgi:Alpha/beta hydrolase family